MAYNSVMDIMLIDLKNGIVERLPSEDEAEGLVSGILLHREKGEDSLVITSPPSSSVADSSINSWSIVWHSPLLGHEESVTLSSPHGYSLWKLGIKALVITGRGDRLKYISLSQDNTQILPCENLRGASSAMFEEVAKANTNDCVLSTGSAGDNGVKYAVLESQGRILPGIDLGHCFFLHNIKGIVFPALFDRKNNENSIPQKNIEKSARFRNLRAWGGYSYITDAMRLGWLPVRACSDRFDPRAFSLDGKSMMEKYGSYPDGCPNCFLACDRTTSSGHPLPSWREMMTLGTNLGLFSPECVDVITSAVREEGLNPSVVGTIISYFLFENKREGERYGFSPSSVSDITAFIHKLGSGVFLFNGLEDLPAALQCYDHSPVDFDLRGASSMALSYSSGLSLFLGATMIFPKRRPNEKCTAIISFYEALYTLGLKALGYPDFCSDLGYWSRVPQLAYHIPFLARLYAKRFHAFGHYAKGLQEKGMEVLDMLSPSWHGIPSHFIMDSESKKGSETVPLLSLQRYWDEEKLRLEISLKSRREKRVKPEKESTPKVGPEEDLGREGEPGLK